MRRHASLLAVLPLVLGCAGDEVSRILLPPALALSGVRVTVLDSPVQPQAVVRVEFESSRSERLTFNPCWRSVERQTAGGWTAEPPEMRVCTAQAYYLEPGSSRIEQVDMPADLRGGTYRFVFPAVPESAAPGAPQVSLVSAPFTVTAAR